MSDGREDFLTATDVSRETMAKLDIYAKLLSKWSPRINLVAQGSVSQVWTRHFLDSAQLIDLVPEKFESWVDIGSGGGFPGAVAAILAAGKGCSANFALVEADQRKAAFLKTLAREAGVPFAVISRRIEDLDPQAADVISARALAPLPKLLDYASKHLAIGGTALFLKGGRFAEELANAKKTWSFRVEVVPSMTDKEAAILKIGEIERV